MSNSMFNNTRNLIPGQTARGDAVDDKFDAVASGFDAVETQLVEKALRVIDGPHQINLTAGNRANRLVGFDGAGAVTTYPIAGMTVDSTIDDGVVSGTTTWSSAKTLSEIRKAVRSNGYFFGSM